MTIKDKEEEVVEEQLTIESVKEEEVVEEEDVVGEEVVEKLLKAPQLLLSIKKVKEENMEKEDMKKLLKFMQEEGVMVEIP